jgi:DNA-binding GntR family transcriptional regulator
MQAAQLARLQQHLAEEQAALAGPDVGRRSYLLGDFHVCLAECLGNQLLADLLRDLTARTTLIAMLYQSTHDAVQSCAEHVEIVQALQAGDSARAEALMAATSARCSRRCAAPPPTTTRWPSSGKPWPRSSPRIPTRRAPRAAPPASATYLGDLL